jgi:hypothetical protein
LTEPTSTSAFIQFEVRDTGVGISPENQARIFGAFSQADGAMNRRYGGTGLGQAIAKDLCELMGGSIEVTSQQGWVRPSGFPLVSNNRRPACGRAALLDIPIDCGSWWWTTIPPTADPAGSADQRGDRVAAAHSGAEAHHGAQRDGPRVSRCRPGRHDDAGHERLELAKAIKSDQSWHRCGWCC